MDNPFETIEEGFWLISKVINAFTENATIAFLIIGSILWWAIYNLYKSKSKAPLLAMLFMMTITGRMFYTLEIAVRQTCSIIVILFGIICLSKSNINSWKQVLHNKWSIYGILLCLASITIHRTTGMLMGILLVLYFVRFNKTLCYSLVVGFAVFAVFGAAVFAEFFDTAMLLVGGLKNENVNLLGDRYMGDVADNKGFSTGAMLGWVIPTLLTIYYTKKENINDFFFKVFIFTYCLHQVMQYSTMHERLITLFMLLGFSASIPEICSKKKQKYHLYLIIGLYYILFSTKVFETWPIKDDTAVPYYFIWQ